MFKHSMTKKYSFPIIHINEEEKEKSPQKTGKLFERKKENNFYV